MQLDSYSDLYAEAHAHSPQCWWDHLKPGWVCPPVESSVSALSPDLGQPVSEPVSVPVA